MRSYEEALAAALDKPAFSNGTQGDMWMDNWCDRCIHDKPTRQGKAEDGCDLIMVALMGKTPIEWLAETKEQRIFADYHCIEFRDEDDKGDPGPPKPIPDPPDQMTLLSREPYEGTRMLADVVAEIKPAEVS